MKESEIQREIINLFNSYEEQFNQALEKKMDWETMQSFYAEEFIGANPQGVKTGQNNAELKEAMIAGFEYYRSIGTKKMVFKNVETTLINDTHVVADVEWLAIYSKDREDIEIPFKNNYFIQLRENQPVIFGWVTGDEMQLLKEFNII